MSNNGVLERIATALETIAENGTAALERFQPDAESASKGKAAPGKGSGGKKGAQGASSRTTSKPTEPEFDESELDGDDLNDLGGENFEEEEFSVTAEDAVKALYRVRDEIGKAQAQDVMKKYVKTTKEITDEAASDIIADCQQAFKKAKKKW